jgi:hypothetical protein
MKNNSTLLLLNILILAIAGTGGAVAAPGSQNPGIPGKVQRNAADIADNFSQIQDNRADIMGLDKRVSDLEAGGGSPGGERSVVEVDCTANGDANALMVDEANSIYFPPNTTYNIHGACNGPLYVTEDGVHFDGVGGTSPAIVLPGYTTNAGNGAIFADGANDVSVKNLLIDASAWGTLAAQGSDAAGVYARNAFIRLRDVQIIGSLFAINPYRNAIVRLDGEINIEDFVNAGVSAGDQSLVTARGQVNISSNVMGSEYLVAIEAYRGGLIDFRGGVTTNFASENDNADAISLSQLSQLRIRSNDNIAINGSVFIGSTSQLRMDGGMLAGEIFVRDNSSLFLRNMTQTEGEIALEANSSANLNNADVGMLSARSNSSVQVFEGSLTGANLDQGATASFYGPNLSGDVVLFSATYLDFFSNGTGGLNGKTVFKCGEYVVANADEFDLGGPVVIGCPVFPPPP